MSANPAVPPSLQQVFEAGERHLMYQVAPHPYKLADRVFRAMNLDARDAARHENQTIILTGDLLTPRDSLTAQRGLRSVVVWCLCMYCQDEWTLYIVV
jgi:hypothetical protein